MKILKAGTVINALRFTCKCFYCETLVEFIEGDPEVTPFRDNEDSIYWKLEYKCPICEEINCQDDDTIDSIRRGIISLEDRKEMTRTGTEWGVDPETHTIHMSDVWTEYVKQFN